MDSHLSKAEISARDPINHKRAALSKFAGSSVLSLSYGIFAFMHDLPHDLIAAVFMFSVPVLGFLVTPFLKTLLQLEAFIFIIKIYSLSAVVFILQYWPGFDDGFAMRAAILYGLMFFVYTSDFILFDVKRFAWLLFMAVIGALILPVDVVSKAMLLVMMLFVAITGFDGMRVREENRQLYNSLRAKNQQLEDNAQQLRIEKEKANAANLAKSQFVANMSHEIRTPMHAVMGMLTLAMKNELDNKVRTQLLQAKSSADSLLGIINDILDFSKIEAGRIELEFNDFDLPKLIRDKIAVIQPIATQKHVEVRLEIDKSVPNYVIGDELRVGQILINLLGNAVKFTDRQGSVTVKVRANMIASDRRQIVLSVTDTGIGMSPEEQKKLFQSFSQADASTTRVYGGTGLGLTISKRFVELMGGWIAVDSEPGKGSTFTVSVEMDLSKHRRRPFKTNHVNEDDLQAALKIVRDRHVLLVEDNEINQEIGRELLESEGIKVSVVSNGQQALAALAENPDFDMVLMDCMMPVMDGYEATRQIRLKPEFINLPIIAMTASTLTEDIDHAMQAGMNAFTSKPIQMDHLLMEMAQWMPRTKQ